MVGGSRDHPQPISHHCKKTPGCPFRSFEKGSTTSHEASCTEVRVQQLLAGKDQTGQFECPYEGCAFVPAIVSERPAKLLAAHVKQAHSFDPKACHLGCEPSRLYFTASSLKYHISHAHSERWPAKCTFPGCNHAGTFAVHSALKYHLRTKHNLNNEGIKLYIPPLPAKQVYMPQTCFMEGCETFFRKQGAHTAHLQRTHALSAEDARAAISARAQFESIVPETVVGRKRAPSGKATEIAQEPPSKKKKVSRSSAQV